jgi:cyclic peptide transporter
MIRRRFKPFFAALMGLMLLSGTFMFGTAQADGNSGQVQPFVTKDKLKQIDNMVRKEMKKGKIPGLSLVIVAGDRTVYQKGFGYADLQTKSAVEPTTLFELGSNTKAITGLAVLKLVQEQAIRLTDPVQQYLPWFSLRNGGDDITLGELLHHTSGISFTSIGDIPESSRDNALLQTVKTLHNQSLSAAPGAQFEYATINYDVLGLIVQQVSGKSYEEYVQSEILQPLGLTHTTFLSSSAAQFVATGYKMGFLKPRAFAAPAYRGNTPAGYALMDTGDLAEWMKLQLGVRHTQPLYSDIIEQSHEPDRTVAPSAEGASYAAGWNIFQDESGEWSHGGENPNYSSYIVMRPGDQLGVGVLANLNSAYTADIGQNTMNVLKEKKMTKNVTDTMVYIDKISFMGLMVALPILVCTAALSVGCIIQIFRKQRVRQWTMKRAAGAFAALAVFLYGAAYCICKLPDIMFYSMPWSFVKVWGPFSLIPALAVILGAVIALFLLFLLTSMYPKPRENSLFIVTILSFVSGLGNASLIMIINSTFAYQTTKLQTSLLLFFILAVVVYVYGQRLVRVRLLHITNQRLYEKRVELIRKIQYADYERIHQMEDGKIHAVLNNDTETLSVFANLLVTAFTSLITLICCFIYIGLINFYGFLLSFAIILAAAGLYSMVGKYANTIYEQTRDVQNVFYRFIHDLLGGFKELKLNRAKRLHFQSDMIAQIAKYRDYTIKATLGFANVFVAGELMFTLVIGVVVFVFPILFTSMESNQLRNYIFIFLYMTGPVNSILSTIPEMLRNRISYKRINMLIQELHEARTPDSEETSVEGPFESLLLDGVEYTYRSREGAPFSIGPVSLEFVAGEITFITGGNGSGKSTLGLLLTGLYKPAKGFIYMNGVKVEAEMLSRRVSAIFNDFYLFSKLYGIAHEAKQAEITKYLKLLRMEEKVSIRDGIFSTTGLSTGQRKRLGLLVTYLEDREIFFFDEWAADQEPEFRDFFYNDLLQELKQRGKCVIAITHDDRYFDRADYVIKMEMGKAHSSTGKRM